MSMYTLKSDITVSFGSVMALSHNDASITDVVSSGGGIHVIELHPTHTSITVNTDSTFTVSNVAVFAFNSKSNNDFHITAVFVAHTPSFTTIHTNSSMIISNNSAVMSSVTVGSDSWWWSFPCWSSPTTVTASSSFTISNNSITATDMVVGGYARWGVMHSWNYPLTITDSSSFVISDIRVTVLNLKASGLHWVGIFMDLPKTPNTVRTSSSLSISGIAVDLTNVVVSDNLVWNLLRMKSTSATISSSSTLSIADNSLSLINANAKQGMEWYGLHATDSPIAITSGNALSISKNSLTTSVVSGSLGARLVSMKGFSLGLTAPWGECGTLCGDPHPGAVYLCGLDMSSSTSSFNSQELKFDCAIAPTTTTSSPPTTTPRSSPPEQEERESGSGVRSAIIISVVVGFTLLSILTFGVVKICCCWKDASPNTSQPQHQTVEMTTSPAQPEWPTTVTDQQQLEQSTTTTYTDATKPVMGVPIEAVTEKGREEAPYGAGGCYL